jgi:hypothetical protein
MFSTLKMETATSSVKLVVVGVFHPEDGDSRFLLSTGYHLPIYTVP